MAKTIENLYLLAIPEVQALFIEAMEKVTDRAIIDEMVKAIENNDVEALYSASGMSQAVLSPILDRIEQVYKDAAEYQVGLWPSRVQTPFGARVPVFNMRNPRVEEELLTNSSRFITDIEEETRKSVMGILGDGQIRGLNPRATALNIVGRINPTTKKREGGVIGMSSQQVSWSLRARQYLENLDEKYLTLGLRDKRFDRIVEDAIKNGKKLTTDNIDKLISAYNTQALRWRGNNIAVTESSMALNKGEYIAIQQSIDEGLFTAEQVTKWWDDSGDGRTRLTHLSLGKKYNRKAQIPFTEPFVSDKGFSLMYPTDRSLGAPLNEVINCRCKATYFVNFTGG